MTPTIRSIVLALILGALIAPVAQASPQQTSIMMDDDLLVYRNDSVATRALAQMKSIGVDTVRVTVLWKVVAESARPTKGELAKLKGKPKERALRQLKRFKAQDPGTYPKQNWDRYDNLVRAAKEQGIRVYFNLTGPGPLWAQTTPPKKLNRLFATYKPKAGAFKRFVQAVGRRFDGTYRDENANRSVLPRVAFWSLWNEPNQGGWLSPQWETRNGVKVPTSPALFRELYHFGYQGLVASGHAGDIILLGETAPLGSDVQNEKSPMRPKKFLRELFCIQDNGTPYTGAAAKARDCGDFAARGPLRATGYAHHPYTKNVGPTVKDASFDSLTMANIDELGTLLDQIAGQTGQVTAGLPLFMTEFGFETNPPDPFSGVAEALQAKYNTVGEYMAYLNPRILSQAQFLLYDVPPLTKHKPTSKAYWFTYQSGLFSQGAKAKPAAFAYSMPFLVTLAGVDEATASLVFNFWGQLRFLRNGLPELAQIQWRPKDLSLDWATVGEPVAVDERGYYTATLIAPGAGVPGEWRAVWINAEGAVGQASLIADGS